MATMDENYSPNKATSKKGTSKTVEQTYQKKTQLEHILLRPDTYIGSVEKVSQPMFVVNDGRIKQKNITFVPGLFKIFDEILVNASDNKQRDSTMDKLDVVIDGEANNISVKNNGKGIPVVMHKEHGCYVPELIFGHLLTGSNFEDSEKKTTGGRNGFGAKLANIFSTSFTIECVDTTNGLRYLQEFNDNMGTKGKPTVSKLKAADKADYTKISFSPDLTRFKMDSLDADTCALLSRRAYDIAGSMASAKGKKLKVSLNGEKLDIKSFKDYVALHDGIKMPDAFEKINDRWEVGVAVSDGSFQQVSFVNSINTYKGGQHATYIADQVASHLVGVVKKKNKGTEVKANQIKNHLCVFVNCLIENPAFDSQTKEALTTRPKAFGSTCVLPPKFLKSIEKSGVVDSILAFAKFKQNEQLKRKGGAKKIKLTGIAKLDDANHAGSAKSKDCTLIITEGDSAKSLAMSGLSVVGRDFYGVFPLKGKPLNVREAAHKQIMSNDEIKNIVDIMGLKFGMIYDEDTVKTLRYGHLMIMADQDHDGSHIKGLVINFIHHFWPSLLNLPGFLQQFITPIVKVTKGKRAKTFFTLPEYENWKEENNDAKGWHIKYYKGLGTSTSSEAKDYFSNLKTHEISFGKLSDDPAGGDAIDMAFAKNRVEDRKIWLNNLDAGTFLNYSNAQLNGVEFSDFVNKELILFSQADNARSIPHVFDGFKPSQRKVLFSCFKRKLKGEIKVAQLAGYVGEHSAYHHGEMSLTGTIIGMAQSFVGSNNINLLVPSGQFGTRRMGGKDSASPRYVFTKLEKITRTIFHPDDDELLNYLNDDGLSIEPEYYMPVIPLVLVNGSDGIGTGWSSNTPNFSAREVIANIRRMINNEPVERMIPSFAGFNGDIIPETGKREGSFVIKGKIERLDDKTLLISELPIRKWTQDYKVFLEGMLVFNAEEAIKEKKKEKVKTTKMKKLTKAQKEEMEEDEIEEYEERMKASLEVEPIAKAEQSADLKDFKENHTDNTVSFTLSADPTKIDSWEKAPGGLMAKFKLTGSLSTSNMNLFDEKGRIAKYNTPEVILKTFFNKRLSMYSDRKEKLLSGLRREHGILANKAKFVTAVCDGDLKISNRKRSELLAQLVKMGFETFEKDTKKKEDGDDEESDDEEETSDAELAKGFEYLMGMKLWTLTREKVTKLQKELAEKTAEVEELEATAPHQIWWNDLDAIEDALDERDVEIAQAAAEERAAAGKAKKVQAARNKKAAKNTKKKKKKDDWDSDSDDDEDDIVFAEDDFSDDDMVVTKKSKKTTKSKPKSNRPAAPSAAPITEEVVEGVSIFTEKTKKEIIKKEVSIEQEIPMESLSLADRMAAKMGKAKKAAAPAPKRAGRGAAKKNNYVESDDEEEAFDTIECDADLSQLDMSTFDIADLTPAKKGKGKGKKAATKKAPAKKAKKVESEDEFEEEVVVPRARGGGRAKKTVDYAAMADKEEESDFDDESEDDFDDESDFE
ncbi:hypothetical protein TrST_g1955 [Triparma strigata]|uniref:DNA topoisomerase 2 n=1 Tax=Triparma strigata TaxID=1606541 RepID=A0A9W7B4K9_9STRA|nr:hypothetical protein TrST_g1955 [Triparma strigata]